MLLNRLFYEEFEQLLHNAGYDNVIIYKESDNGEKITIDFNLDSFSESERKEFTQVASGIFHVLLGEYPAIRTEWVPPVRKEQHE